MMRRLAGDHLDFPSHCLVMLTGMFAIHGPHHTAPRVTLYQPPATDNPVPPASFSQFSVAATCTEFHSFTADFIMWRGAFQKFSWSKLMTHKGLVALITRSKQIHTQLSFSLLMIQLCNSEEIKKKLVTDQFMSVALALSSCSV